MIDGEMTKVIDREDLIQSVKDFFKDNPLVAERFLNYCWADQKEDIKEWLK